MTEETQDFIDDALEERGMGIDALSILNLFKSELGFAANYRDPENGISDPRLDVSISNQSSTSAIKNKITATVWHKETIVFYEAVNEWVKNSIQEVKHYSSLFSDAVFLENRFPASFFVSLLILNQKGNILKKGIAEFFRQYKEDYFLAINTEGGEIQEIFLEFTSNKVMNKKMEKIAGIDDSLHDLSFVYGGLRWKLTTEKETSFLSGMLQDNNQFLEFTKKLSKEKKELIFYYEQLRFLIMKYNNLVKDLFFQSVNYILNQKKMDFLENELFNEGHNE